MVTAHLDGDVGARVDARCDNQCQHLLWGSVLRVQGSGFRVQSSGFRVQGSRFRVWDLGFGVYGPPNRLEATLIGIRVEG